MSFLQAVAEWNARKASYIKAHKKARRIIAERVEILLTIPKECENEFKDLAKKRRQEFDAKSNIGDDQNLNQLAIAFEKENPPPHRQDYE